MSHSSVLHKGIYFHIVPTCLDMVGIIILYINYLFCAVSGSILVLWKPTAVSLSDNQNMVRNHCSGALTRLHCKIFKGPVEINR
jgi:hypothetical protein